VAGKEKVSVNQIIGASPPSHLAINSIEKKFEKHSKLSRGQDLPKQMTEVGSGRKQELFF